ncbi:MAG TPA: hypothetical protein VK923_15785 [Euzebyales bacterium]|nr:hypothetical protein [Euzebyales bacterium]
MTVLAQVDIEQSLQEGLSTVLNFLPKFLAFLAILVIGWFVAKALQRIVNAVLERVGFDRAVERGGVKTALARTQYDASDILAKIAFYAIMLFVLQLAFGVFGPNPVSELLYGIIAFLPRIFVAIIVVVVAAAIAAAVREIIAAALGSLAYGAVLANAASIIIISIGVFAALSQLHVAPAIVNGLFYSLLALVVGVIIVAVGGGGIAPMRPRWERALTRLEVESRRMRGSSPYGAWTREELYERAQEIDLEGRSSMSKEELIDALTQSDQTVVAREHRE